MKIRRLNDDGLAQFEDFVETLRGGNMLNTPLYLLEGEATSEPFAGSLEIEQRDFPSRYELGVYLAELFSGLDMQPLVGDSGFWSWLALYWFDQLCPPAADGSRKPQMAYSYVLSDKWKHRPRHSIYTTWQLVNQFGTDSRFLLSKALPVRGELIEQMMARQYFFGCDGVIRLASDLYFDEERNTFKVGAAARKSAGCVYRYVGWLQQLEVNYDLYSVTGSQLKELLPAEFDRFRVPSQQPA